jgi:hypothetical protein
VLGGGAELVRLDLHRLAPLLLPLTCGRCRISNLKGTLCNSALPKHRHPWSAISSLELGPRRRPPGARRRRENGPSVEAPSSVRGHHAAHGELGHLPPLRLGRLVGEVLALLQRPQVVDRADVVLIALDDGGRDARAYAVQLVRLE